MFAKGHNGQITFEGGWITIERKGLGRIGHSKGDKRIRVDQIIGIKMRPAGPIANGFIAFEMTGRPFDGGLSEATKNDNAVIFTRKQRAEFDALRTAIESAMAGVADSEPIPQAAVAQPVQPPSALPPAGWYSDPERPGQQRWWDGTAWGVRDTELPPPPPST